VYAIQSPSPGSLPEWTVENLATLYLEAIREIQPAGPYLLGGWSMGGIVAFEMARQSGSAPLLLMIDVAPPGRGEAGEPDPQKELAGFAEDLKRLGGIEAPEAMEAAFALFQANRRALQAYRPRSFEGRALLIRAEATAEADRSGRFEAWRDLITGGAEIQVLPGDHYSLLREPRLAEALMSST